MTFISPINVFIGTAYSGEQEFEDCIKSIDKQINVTVRHYIVFNNQF